MRTRLERETCIIWNDAESEATITSSSPVFCRKMKRLGYSPDTEWPGHAMDNQRWKLRKKAISVRRPRVTVSGVGEGDLAARNAGKPRGFGKKQATAEAAGDAEKGR